MRMQEIEGACERSHFMEVSRPQSHLASYPLSKRFHPYGFPVQVGTNSAEVLNMLDAVWGKFERRFDTPPVRSEAHVVEGSSRDCPPLPAYRFMSSLFLSIADQDNYSIVDMERSITHISLSQAALLHKLYATYYFLTTPVSCIAARYATAIHAGCVALDGRGVLLCGDSGAGKSTLSYACARSGWTYISDDGTYLLNSGVDRMVSGNCYRVRFRPSAAQLFPEIEELRMMPRAAGKPSVELHTETMPQLNCSQAAHVGFIVFLNRSSKDREALVPHGKEVARHFLQQTLYAPPAARVEQRAAIERLLTAEVFELRYGDLHWAVNRLQRLVKEGQ